jgi:cyclase
MHSYLIVERMDPESIDYVAQRFAEFDASEVPHLMGTRRRELFAHQGLYLHLQQFDAPVGAEVFRRAWAHPRFASLRADIGPLFGRTAREPWGAVNDCTATRFYRWEASQ